MAPQPFVHTLKIIIQFSVNEKTHISFFLNARGENWKPKKTTWFEKLDKWDWQLQFTSFRAWGQLPKTYERVQLAPFSRCLGKNMKNKTLLKFVQFAEHVSNVLSLCFLFESADYMPLGGAFFNSVKMAEHSV